MPARPLLAGWEDQGVEGAAALGQDKGAKSGKIMIKKVFFLFLVSEECTLLLPNLSRVF